jgi:hypothetical protein
LRNEENYTMRSTENYRFRDDAEYLGINVYEKRGMIYIPSFIKIGSGIQKLLGRGIHIHTDTQAVR